MKRLFFFLMSFVHAGAFTQSVDHLTGGAQVLIPLHTVSAGGITIPLNLAHHGGSVKVQEPAGKFLMQKPVKIYSN